MKKLRHLLTAIGLLACVAAPSAAVTLTTTGYYSLQYDTVKGTSTIQIAGEIKVAQSSMTLSTAKVIINGTTGFITLAGALTLSGASANAVFPASTTVSGVFGRSASFITIDQTGAAGYITSVSSVNAASFWGDGSHLTGIGVGGDGAVQFVKSGSLFGRTDKIYFNELTGTLALGTGVSTTRGLKISSTVIAEIDVCSVTGTPTCGGIFTASSGANPYTTITADGALRFNSAGSNRGGFSTGGALYIGTDPVAAGGTAGDLYLSGNVTSDLAVIALNFTQNGAAGRYSGASSVTASGFFGDGSQLKGIPSTSSISGVYLPLAGGYMSGQLTNTSSITATVRMLSPLYTPLVGNGNSIAITANNGAAAPAGSITLTGGTGSSSGGAGGNIVINGGGSNANDADGGDITITGGGADNASTPGGGDVTITAGSGNNGDGGVLTLAGGTGAGANAGYIAFLSSGIERGRLSQTGNLTFYSSVTASAFYGNGAGLVGVTGTEANTYTSSKTFTSTVQTAALYSTSSSFRNSISTQAQFYGMAVGVPSDLNGSIGLGNAAVARGILQYQGNTNGFFYLDNTYNNDNADFVFRSKTSVLAQENFRIRGNGHAGFGVAAPASSWGASKTVEISTGNNGPSLSLTNTGGTASRWELIAKGGSSGEVALAESGTTLWILDKTTGRMTLGSTAGTGVGGLIAGSAIIDAGSGVSTVTVGNASNGSGSVMIYANSGVTNGITIGPSVDLGARIRYNSNGNLDISPREGFHINFRGGGQVYSSSGTWTPAWTGFSADPTGTTAVLQIGKMVKAEIELSGHGTSNATTLTVTLPVAAKRATSYPMQVVDNGTNVIGVCDTAAASNILTCYASSAYASFTGSGLKSVRINISYIAN
ncbi:MAG: hypothetical protein KGZ65_04365 [Sphingomonadales bacterium]|nr:hypothetical protein [Sphingomonadaceae bacterium]MBS3930448.1 hypothetical protein [Sphingomonadales bacterium]